MSFLTEQNLTFHRFSDGTISGDVKKNPLNNPELLPDGQTQSIWTTNTALDYSVSNSAMNASATSTTNILPSTIDDSIDKNDGTKRYSAYSIGNNSTYSSNVGNTTQHNGSTLKLIQVKKDESDSSSKQVSSFTCCKTLNTQLEKFIDERTLRRHADYNPQNS